MAAPTTTYYMQRNTNYPGASNTTRTGDTSVKYLKRTWTSSSSEVVYLPTDNLPVGLYAKFASGAITIQATYSAPDLIDAGNADWFTITVPTSFSAIAATTSANIGNQGYVAIQPTSVTGSWVVEISV